MLVKCLAQGHIDTQVSRAWDPTSNPLIEGRLCPQPPHLEPGTSPLYYNYNRVIYLNTTTIFFTFIGPQSGISLYAYTVPCISIHPPWTFYNYLLLETGMAKYLLSHKQ